MTIGQRILLTIVIVLVILFALAAFGYFSGRWDDQPFYMLQSSEVRAEPRPVPPSKYDARILQLNREAAERAYSNQIQHLFQVWMKDDTGQPQRAAVGARKARQAFIAVMEALERDEAALQQ